MSKKTDSRRATAGELPRDARAEAILEFVFNDEEEALCNVDFALSHQGEMPAVQEFLREMHELDARGPGSQFH
jgi:hypothetical protein